MKTAKKIKIIRDKLGFSKYKFAQEMGNRNAQLFVAWEREFKDKGSEPTPEFARLIIKAAKKNGLEISFNDIYGESR